MYDFVIVGGGIVGLSTAVALGERYPDARLLLVEKEGEWAHHQTGNNSGVIHSGIYYRPGSLKARFAREGNALMVGFCREYGIEHEVCGKVIVATRPEEVPLLDGLYERGLANGLEVSRIDGEALREIEPHVRGIAAIHVPSTGIVNFKQVAERFARLVEEQGGDLRLNTEVESVVARQDGLAIESNSGSFQAKFLINCAGLHSDRLARTMGAEADVKIVPFRGEYYELTPEKRYLVKNLIYPVPNPDFPFLGVHFTRMIDGSVHAGPNAVLSFKREGYTKRDFDLRDSVETLTYPGFWKLAAANWKEGAREMVRSFSKAAFVRSLQRLIPEVQADDVVPTHAGVRAQALMEDGKLVDDFLIVPSHRAIHVLNAPSPAATASIAIGRAVVEQTRVGQTVTGRGPPG